MEVLKETIQHLMQGLRKQKKSASVENDPWFVLKQELGRRERGHIQLNYFKEGILSITVDSSPWLYHFNLKKEELLQVLRKKSSVIIKDIRFYLGEIR